MSPEEVAPLRAEEQRRACNIVGVDDLEILDFPDGLLEPTHELRRAIARKIREFRPNAVVVTTFDLQVQWGLNHVDHRHAGVATVDAIRDADNPWVFTDLKDEGLEAWKADRLLINGAQPTHAVALTAEHVNRGVRSLEAHKVYLDALGDHPAPKDMIPSIATSGGELAGVDYALPITVVEM
ncbi:GlcNAc-PI de-N-acetylase [Brevibacterium aurantiacum]|nr:GlcNAc-PI de-N-acetylase [Brevibacterium aurantiacum]